MNLEEAVLGALGDRPGSGGRLLERFEAAGKSPFSGAGVLVYGALANLAAAGRAEAISEGPGEVVYGLPGARLANPPRPPGIPPSFALGIKEISRIDRELLAMTDGLPGHWFEELRRFVVASADRHTSEGASPARAVSEALLHLGPPAAARRFLRRAGRGAPVALRMLRLPVRLLVAPLVLVAAAALLRLFVLGVHTMPPESASMAPALIPAVEGGDALVLSDLTAPWRRPPARGEIVTFRHSGSAELLVKRVWGLPGETIEIREGDLFVDGKRLVKERDLLERVMVPLGAGDAVLEEREGLHLRVDALHRGYLLPDGSVDREAGDVRDIVFSFTVEVSLPGETLTVILEDGSKAPPTIVLDTTGHASGVSIDGVEIARGPTLKLALGAQTRVWCTNADRLLRVAIDGTEAARGVLHGESGTPGLSLRTEGERIVVRDFRIARDLVPEDVPGPRDQWKLGAGEFFVLGDNSTHSRDSRHFGPIRSGDIEGRLLAVAWPPSRWRWIR